MHSKSKELFERAQTSIPGGVNSPARAFQSVGGDPLFFERATGSIMIDVDGNQYIDYVGSWGPMILGHAYPAVVKAVQDAAFDSTSFGASTEIEVRAAEKVCEMVPNLEKIRMVNSGTEACMSAIRLARGHTGREKIIKFEGNYHGHSDSFLIKTGSGALTLGTPSSPGVTAGTAADTLVASFNNLESVEALVEKNPGEVAAIILEPVAGNMGCVPPEEKFLKGVRALCDEKDIILIFDEVMTGFRIARGGAQERYDIPADLVTFGKIIGAGLPVGAFGGNAEIMSSIAPEGPVYQAGTLSGNPLAMHAGYALLNVLDRHPEIYVDLEEKGAYLAGGLRDLLSGKDIPFRLNQTGSMLSLFFTDQDVHDFETAAGTDKKRFSQFFRGMLERGIYLPPSPFETWFLAASHNYEMLDDTLNAADEVLTALDN